MISTPTTSSQTSVHTVRIEQSLSNNIRITQKKDVNAAICNLTFGLMMKIHELIKELASYPMDATVYLYVDVERYGNFIFDYFEDEKMLDLTASLNDKLSIEEKAFVEVCSMENIASAKELRDFIIGKRSNPNYNCERYTAIADARNIWKHGINYAEEMGSSN